MTRYLEKHVHAALRNLPVRPKRYATTQQKRREIPSERLTPHTRNVPSENRLSAKEAADLLGWSLHYFHCQVRRQYAPPHDGRQPLSPHAKWWARQTILTYQRLRRENYRKRVQWPWMTPHTDGPSCECRHCRRGSHR